MPKKVAISYPEVFNKIKIYFGGKDVDIISFDANVEQINCSAFDLVIFYDELDFVNDCDNVVNVHPALLPAYKSKSAIEKIFSDGIKVSGVTIHSKNKIIAQYPILIGLDTHVDDYLNEVHSISEKLLPPVIDAILADKVFDFKDLFSNSCSKGGCSGCDGCH